MENQQYKPLKYQGYAIVLQEVPDEITLAFNISGCTHKCPNCHSKNLWEYEGNYIREDIKHVLSKYKNYISCVCFMGGDQNIKELSELCEIVKKKNLKTCIYSGMNSFYPFNDMINNNLLDYLKLGKYDSQKGGLDSPNTNQVMYKIINKTCLININNKFRRKFT